MKYPITEVLLPINSKRRSGKKITKVGFLVAHDTGNPNSTARNNYIYFNRTAYDESSSAHFFVDDKEILMLIPAITNPEKAWHVLYNMPKDNELFGDDANDIAIGIELCYGSFIDAAEAYKRYVWLLAYLCYIHRLSPRMKIISHAILDPRNRSDPNNALMKMGKNFGLLIEDIVIEYDNILREEQKMGSGVFKDVPDNHYAKKAVEWFGKNGIVLGDGKGNFSPNTFMTRADSCLVLYKTLVKAGIIKED